jgi:hypothetical protein
MTLTTSGIASLRQLRHLVQTTCASTTIRDGWQSVFARKNAHGQKPLRRLPGRDSADRETGGRCSGSRSRYRATLFFAVQAGARHVYAIEVSGIADVAAELIEVNGFRDRITLIRENSKKVRLPERCNVLVTETLSSFCFDEENIIEAIADARRTIPEAWRPHHSPIGRHVSRAVFVGFFRCWAARCNRSGK